jgi:hypothetical protein
MELPAISWIALRRPAVLGKASRGASGNNRQNAPHAIIVIVSHDFSVRRHPRQGRDRRLASVCERVDQRIAERVEPTGAEQPVTFFTAPATNSPESKAAEAFIVVLASHQSQVS